MIVFLWHLLTRKYQAEVRKGEKVKTYQKMDLLHALYIMAIVAAELMGAKTFPLGFMSASVAIFLLPITFSINDLVFEVYGRERAMSFMRSGLQILFFLFAFNILAVMLPPTDRFASANGAYALIFSKSLRMTAASLAAFWVSERLDVVVFSRIKAKMSKQSFWLRSNLSNVISMFIDTVVFMTLAFYSPGKSGFLISLIIPYWLLKVSMSVVTTPVTQWGVNWLQRGTKEN